MTQLTVTPDIEAAPWSDLSHEMLKHNKGGKSAEIERIGLLRHGTQQGNATVELLIRLPNGEVVVAETTLVTARDDAADRGHEERLLADVRRLDTMLMKPLYVFRMANARGNMPGARTAALNAAREVERLMADERW